MSVPKQATEPAAATATDPNAEPNEPAELRQPGERSRSGAAAALADAAPAVMNPKLKLGLAFGFTGLWFALMTRFGEGDVYSVIGPYAAVVSATCLVLPPHQHLRALAVTRRGVLAGVLVGVLMTALTYPVFRIANHFIPTLEHQVRALYHSAHSTTVPVALAWLSAIVLGEELLFRDLLPQALELWTARWQAYAISGLVYALAQLGSGSFIVALLAACCAAVWSVLRIRTDSLLSAVIAHAIWTPIVIVLYPVV